MNTGILAVLKKYFKLAFIPGLYIGVIWVSLYSVFAEARAGLYLLTSLIPQPNVWYKLHGFLGGKDLLDILFFAILLGIVIQNKGFQKTPSTGLILAFVIFSFIALWNSSLRFSLPLPFTSDNYLLLKWKNYAQMICLYFLILNTVKKEEHQKILIVIMALVILFIAVRNYRNFYGGAVYTDFKRNAGPFEAVRLGSNHFGAFMAHYLSAFLGMYILDKHKWRKMLFLATMLFGLHPLFFSYSRGAYLGAFTGMVFFGVMKKRILLIVPIILFVAWQTLLPPSVVNRIEMTQTETGQIESSAASRFVLWDQAFDIFRENPLIGVGFGGYGFLVPEGQSLTDTHNFYMKTLCEQGVIGIALLILIFGKAFRSGWRLFKIGQTPFNQGLGLGFMGCVVACMTTNIFGDRFSYFALGGYFWILWGLVDRGILISQAPLPQEEDLKGEDRLAASDLNHGCMIANENPSSIK